MPKINRNSLTPAQQAEYLMNEATLVLADVDSFEDFLHTMTQNLVEDLWTGEVAPTADEVEDYDGDAYGAWWDTCPDAFDAALDALTLLAVIRSDAGADSTLAAWVHQNGENDGVYESLEGRYVGIGSLLRQYGYLS